MSAIAGITFTVIYEMFVKQIIIKLRSWIKTKFYSGLKIGETTWDAIETYHDTDPPTQSTFSITFRQNGENLTAICIGTEGPDKGKQYEMKGSIWQHNITMTWEPIKNVKHQKLERGTLSLQVRGDDALEGVGAFYSDITGAFHNSEIKANRLPRQ